MAEENAGFLELIEKVEKSNTHLHKVEEHTRNSRRHLLEMKKSVFSMAEATELLATPNEEERREDVARQERLIDAVKESGKGGLADTGRGGGADGKTKRGLASFLGSGLGGFLGAAGLGAGAATAGLGVLMAGGGFLLQQLAEFDGEAVKKNILALTDIGDELVAKSGSMKEAFKDGGLLMFMLGGLGTALIAFGIGSGINAAVDKFAGDSKWAENTKLNVETLLSISDLKYTATSVLGVSGALAGLGAGLIFFGAGSAAASAGAGIDATVDKFITDGGFAENVKNNVKTLLSIADLKLGDTAAVALALGGLGAGLVIFGAGTAVASAGELASSASSAAGQAAGVKTFMDGGGFGQRVHDEVKALLAINNLIPSDSGAFAEGGKFIVIMSGLSAGLIAFSVGKAVSAAADGVQAGVSYFADSGNAGFADRIKNEVDTLLKIAETPMVEPVKFVSTMTMIGAGLAVFSVGEAATAVSGFLSTFASKDGESTSERIKKEVDTLLSIGQDGDVEKAKVAATAMKDIGIGLTDFAKGEFVGSLANAGAAIVSFFSGGEGPFDKIKALATDADDLTKAGNAIGTVAENMQKIADIKISDRSFSFKKFGNDLKASVPLIEGAILGESGGLFGKDIQGLSKNTEAYAAAAENIKMIRQSIGDANPQTVNNYYYGAGNQGQGGVVGLPQSAPAAAGGGGVVGSAYPDEADVGAITSATKTSRTDGRK